MCWGIREKINHIPSPSILNQLNNRGIRKTSINISVFVNESVSINKIGLSNTIPPMPLPPFPMSGIGMTHPKENKQRKHLPGELQSGVAAPKVETERGALHTCLWKVGLGLSRCM